MMLRHVIAIVLLTLGVGIELLCCLGLLAARRALDRLHYLSPATALGPLLIAAAVVAYRSPPQAEIKSVLVALILLLTSPIVSHVTGRAIVAGSDSGEGNP